MIINFSQFISEKIDLNTNIIWFEKSNKYIIVDDFINNLILNKINSSLYPINKGLKKTNKINSSNLQHIENDLKELLKDCNTPTLKKETKNIIKENKSLEFESLFTFNNRTVKVEYENESLKELIEPKFIHLKTNNKENLLFKVLTKNKKLLLFKENLFLGEWDSTEMHEFQGKVSMELTSFFHNKKNKDWTAVFHGSTLYKDNNSLMLTGDSGSGKSSLSAMLMANNFSLIADDFSPMDINSIHYNFPSAISLKEGFFSTAERLFSSFNQLEKYYINEIKGNVKYLADNNENDLILSTNCSKVINVKFGKDLKNEIKQINKGISLQKILPDAWVSNEKTHAKSFIRWIKSSIFYELTYSDNNKAIQMINNIF